MPFRPIKTETETLCCAHWRNWPPYEAIEFEGQSGAELYRSGEIDGVEFQRFQLWERDCGLLQMSLSKCQACLHVRLVEIKPPAVPTLVSRDGKIRTPIIDQPFAASLGQFRVVTTRPAGSRHSQQDAAWVKHNKAKEAEDATEEDNDQESD